MALQRHPVESFSLKLNFWEEFPDYKVHPLFRELWSLNKKNNKLEGSSLFMWALSLCYDRKSSLFSQPEVDKWEVVGDILWGNSDIFTKLIEDIYTVTELNFPLGVTLQTYINAFEESIDTPLGIALRSLERKLVERTAFIATTAYSLDYYEITNSGKAVLRKGTATQLDKMFTDTDKINSLVQKAMNDLRSSEDSGTTKGGFQESMSEKLKHF